MDKTELEIAKISDAMLIKIYIMPNGIMGLLMIYRESCVINLSADDSHFPQLETAAVRCYIANRDAAADSFTAEILEKRSLSRAYPWADRFGGNAGSRLREGMYEKELAKVYLPLLTHCLDMIFRRLGIAMEEGAELTGYRTRYTITVKGKTGEKQMTLIFSLRQDGCCFTVGNIVTVNDSLKISLRCSFGAVDISADLDSSRYIGIREHIGISDGEHILHMFDEDEPIFDSTDSLTVQDTDITSDALLSDGFSKEIPLPWCRVLTGGDETRSIYAVMFGGDDCALIHEFSREYLSDEKSIVTDSLHAVHEIFPHDTRTRICTNFLKTDAFSTGRYKKYVGRYFCRDIKPEV